MLRKLKNECNDIIGKCEKANIKGKNYSKKLESEILANRLSQDELKLLFNTIKELDFANPKSFTLLFSFKVEEINKKLDQVKEVSKEFND
jgi:hypothetical protein